MASAQSHHQLLYRSSLIRRDDTGLLQWAPALLLSLTPVPAHFRRCSKATDRWLVS